MLSKLRERERLFGTESSTRSGGGVKGSLGHISSATIPVVARGHALFDHRVDRVALQPRHEVDARGGQGGEPVSLWRAPRASGRCGMLGSPARCRLGQSAEPGRHPRRLSSVRATSFGTAP